MMYHKDVYEKALADVVVFREDELLTDANDGCSSRGTNNGWGEQGGNHGDNNGCPSGQKK